MASFFSLRMNVTELVVDPEKKLLPCKEKAGISMDMKRHKKKCQWMKKDGGCFFLKWEFQGPPPITDTHPIIVNK